MRSLPWRGAGHVTQHVLGLVALAAALVGIGGCGAVDVVRQTKPSPFTASTPFSVEPINPNGVTDPTSPYAHAADDARSGGAGTALLDNPDRIDPASVDIAQANRVFRAAVRSGGLEVNLTDGDIRPVGAVEIRPSLVRLASTTGTPLTVVGPGVRTTVELVVGIVGPDGRTLDELHFSATAPFYESLEKFGNTVAGYLIGRGAARTPPPVAEAQP